jgi:hypothetical protein
MNTLIDAHMWKARASLAVVIAILSVAPALAYVDPGTGSMLIQMALAAIAGAMFYFRQLRVVAYGLVPANDLAPEDLRTANRIDASRI